MYNRLSLAGAFIAALFLSACKKEDTSPAPTAASYDTTAFTPNSSAERALGDRLAALQAEMARGRNQAVKLDAATLQTLFTTGSPSLRSAATPYYAEQVDRWLAELAAASGNTYVFDLPEAGGQGGTSRDYGYLFDEHGVELEQLIDKGLYGGALYHQVSILLTQPLTPAVPDKILGVLGMSPLFPSSNNAIKHRRPDRQLGAYLARRDKNEGNGFYARVKKALTTLQTGAKAGSGYGAEQQAAATEIRHAIEEATAASVIHYCYQVTTQLGVANLTEQQRGAAMHAYAEGVGFAHGWRGLPTRARRITDAQIDEVLALFGAPVNGPTTSYRFITHTAEELPKLQQITAKLKAIYGFSDAQMLEFQKNWITEQGR
ncbi:hypothetical protein WDZ92_00635 [Nostoc sp. NIES-2111]